MSLIVIFSVLIFGQSQKQNTETNVKFVGTYFVGRGPCQYMDDGIRFWEAVTGFEVNEVALGNVKTGTIPVVLIEDNHKEDFDFPLEIGLKYEVLLKLNKERKEMLQENKYFHLQQTPITMTEIVSIRRIKD